jgi:ABC-type cobalt transport system substrate-binding protein
MPTWLIVILVIAAIVLILVLTGAISFSGSVGAAVAPLAALLL